MADCSIIISTRVAIVAAVRLTVMVNIVLITCLQKTAFLLLFLLLSWFLSHCYYVTTTITIAATVAMNYPSIFITTISST